jgi:hypothetical protein
VIAKKNVKSTGAGVEEKLFSPGFFVLKMPFYYECEGWCGKLASVPLVFVNCSVIIIPQHIPDMLKL